MHDASSCILRKRIANLVSVYAIPHLLRKDLDSKGAINFLPQVTLCRSSLPFLCDFDFQRPQSSDRSRFAAFIHVVIIEKRENILTVGQSARGLVAFQFLSRTVIFIAPAALEHKLVPNQHKQTSCRQEDRQWARDGGDGFRFLE